MDVRKLKAAMACGCCEVGKERRWLEFLVCWRWLVNWPMQMHLSAAMREWPDRGANREAWRYATTPLVRIFLAQETSKASRALPRPSIVSYLSSSGRSVPRRCDPLRSSFRNQQ